MKKKGFTLIELLAVLVILAIIALITIPLVLKTIKNSEKKAEQESILGYARVIEEDIANYVLEPTNNYDKYNKNINNLDDNDDSNNRLKSLNYKGNEITCEGYNVSSDGKLTLTCCKVKGGTGTGYNYEHGKVEESKDPSCNTPKEENNENNEDNNDTAVFKLKEKANDVNAENTQYEQGSESSHQMYAFSHPQTEQTPALTDYRYIGNDPYNYVEFNDEIWRIIGIFTVEDGRGHRDNRIKIIRNEFIGSSRQWHSGFNNDWSGADLNSYLNGEYYNGLSSTAKQMIDLTDTYLGGYNESEEVGGAEDMYRWERGTATYQNRNSVKDTKYITLMYPSDYLYTYAKGIENECYSNGIKCSLYDGKNPASGWLYNSKYNQWTVTSAVDSSVTAFNVYVSGLIDPNNVIYESYVRPVTYLKSTVKLKGGTGTSSNPYKLEI